MTDQRNVSGHHEHEVDWSTEAAVRPELERRQQGWVQRSLTHVLRHPPLYRRAVGQPLWGLLLFVLTLLVVAARQWRRHVLRRTLRYVANFFTGRWWVLLVIAVGWSILFLAFSPQVANTALLGLLSTVYGVVVTWLLVRPGIHIFPRVECHEDEAAPIYTFRWRNQGFLDVSDAKLEAWLHVPNGETRGARTKHVSCR